MLYKIYFVIDLTSMIEKHSAKKKCNLKKWIYLPPINYTIIVKYAHTATQYLFFRFFRFYNLLYFKIVIFLNNIKSEFYYRLDELYYS